RLFQKFSQADASITRRFGGTGLGLSIAKHIVEAMGGKIGVTSTPGQGSQFSFDVTLPVAGTAQELDVTTLRGRRALIIDDNGINRAILADRLTRWGLLVDQAHNARMGRAALKADGPAYDVVFIDRKLPDTDGITLAGEIRAMLTVAPKLILWSSMTCAANQKGAEASKVCDASLFKPVQTSRLLETLKVLLSADAKGVHQRPGDEL
ncbi:MAG TPA: hypothetical protein DCL48_07080, partial [Alphaproteobacteria bacterium]|nr:hypothetical protein [Alphaproteobacteria bacterium]